MNLSPRERGTNVRLSRSYFEEDQSWLNVASIWYDLRRVNFDKRESRIQEFGYPFSAIYIPSSSNVSRFWSKSRERRSPLICCLLSYLLMSPAAFSPFGSLTVFNPSVLVQSRLRGLIGHGVGYFSQVPDCLIHSFLMPLWAAMSPSQKGSKFVNRRQSGQKPPKRKDLRT